MRSFDDKRPLLQIFHGLFHCCILIYDYSFLFISWFFFVSRWTFWLKEKKISIIMQPTSRVGTAFEGSNSPRGPSGASEPPDVFCGLASLIVEGRIPRNDGRGYGEGPHVPQTASKSLSSRHECCNENNVVSSKFWIKNISSIIFGVFWPFWLILAMRILERVQPFCTSFKYWDFIFFPPSYVVTKLAYSNRSFMSKYS